ncbi:hypothetical protein BC751_4360 [Cecembia calidifontis]|uniref:Uncharacterized protein n=1 Tax=Cecembia calidifontis TaxID=1187080 RepID=A0A4Q7PE71_9BACT|nr:hypothetical protein BC751_4360 [Cecembia calidifontis]
MDCIKFVLVGPLSDFIEILYIRKGNIASIRGPNQYIPEFEVDYSAGYPMLQLLDMERLHFYTDVVLGNLDWGIQSKIFLEKNHW